MTDFFKADRTRVDIPLPVHTEPDHGSISQYKPSLIDKISGSLPSTGPVGVLKGVYRGMDEGLFGLLPSGNYGGEQTPETELGRKAGWVADPFAVGKGAKTAVSGFSLFGKNYSTPIGRLIANNVEPLHYSGKGKELIKPLTNWKRFKESVIQDIPQYQIGGSFHPNMLARNLSQDRIYAWRRKFNIDHPPNPIYDERIRRDNLKKLYEKEQMRLDLEKPVKGQKGVYKVTEGELDKYFPLSDTTEDIYKKFGVNPKTGTHHYKKKEDYLKPLFGKLGHPFFSTKRHGLFGGYKRKHGSPQLSLTDDMHYYDDWDFALNRSPLDPKYFINNRTGEKSILSGLNTMLQRKLGNYLTKKVEFKGSFKDRRPTKVLENADFKRNLNKTAEYKEKRRRFFVEKQQADQKAAKKAKDLFEELKREGDL